MLAVINQAILKVGKLAGLSQLQLAWQLLGQFIVLLTILLGEANVVVALGISKNIAIAMTKDAG